MTERGIDWAPRKGGGYKTTVKDLGLVEIYRDSTGNCVDINGKRAWSVWKETHEMMKYTIADTIRTWQYLNSFRAIGE